MENSEVNMKKALPFFLIAIVSVALALRYYSPNLPSFADDSEGHAGNIVDLNQPIPHTVLPAADDNWVNLESFKGKVVLINFWTTWCPGCRDELPELIKLQQKFQSAGFTVVAIAVDDEGEESVKTFVQTESFSVDGSSMPINFPVLLGSDETARKIGFEGGLPASVLVNRDGQEVKLIRGQVHAPEVARLITRLM
jgi:thiol-disulfide isomerase/thioredoxin